MVGILRGRPSVRCSGDVMAVMVLNFGCRILLGLGGTRRAGVQPEAAGDAVNHPLLARRFEWSKSRVHHLHRVHFLLNASLVLMFLTACHRPFLPSSDLARVSPTRFSRTRRQT